jgi:uncharacterized protein YoxC
MLLLGVPISMLVVAVSYLSPIVLLVTNLDVLTMVMGIVSSTLMIFRTSTVLME